MTVFSVVALTLSGAFLAVGSMIWYDAITEHNAAKQRLREARELEAEGRKLAGEAQAFAAAGRQAWTNIRKHINLPPN